MSTKKIFWAAAFLVVWLLVGFSLGTATLLGPVRWLTGELRTLAVGPELERAVMIAVIGIYVVVSAALAGAVTYWLACQRQWWRRVAVPLLLAGIAVGCVYLWMTPAVLLPDTTEPAPRPRAQFTFGSFPSLEKMETLRSQGYTAVVSLLHPAVVPFEPRLIEQERRHARQVGIDFVHAPMLPWVGRNEESLRRLRELVRVDTARYYVHCYLGRDRVRMAARVLREAGASVSFVGEEEQSGYSEPWTDQERGPVYPVTDSVHVGPFLTGEEQFRLLAEGFRSVVHTVPDEDTVLRRWHVETRDGLEAAGVGFHHLPVAEPTRARVRAVVDSALKLPRPVYLQVFRTPSREADSLRTALRRRLPGAPGPAADSTSAP